MKTWTRSAWVVAALTVGATGLSAQGTAQGTAQAVRLEGAALLLSETPADLGRAADLYREAAALRPSGDPIAVKNLIQAARFSFYSGKHDRALRDFAAAAESALRIGDMVAAAESFIDAAWVAQQSHDGTQALRYATRAREVTASPFIRDADRARLLGRMPG